jgi:biotin operon repressor
LAIELWAEGVKCPAAPEIRAMNTTDPARREMSMLAVPEAEQGATPSAIVRMQRALQILRLLQAGQTWSAQELAEQYHCSTRTIFRDLQLLRDCGIPIESPRGEKGFRLAHDFFWQPERPTLDEMIALVVGARMAGEAMPKDMAKSLESAMAKLVGSHRPADRQRLTELKMRIDSPHLVPQPALPEAAYLAQLLEHIVAQRIVRLFVAAQPPDEPARIMEMVPVRLHYAGGEWWLLLAEGADAAPEESIPLARIERIEFPRPPEKEQPAGTGQPAPPTATASLPAGS